MPTYQPTDSQRRVEQNQRDVQSIIRDKLAIRNMLEECFMVSYYSSEVEFEDEVEDIANILAHRRDVAMSSEPF